MTQIDTKVHLGTVWSVAKRKIEILTWLCILSIIRYSKVIENCEERRPSFFRLFLLFLFWTTVYNSFKVHLGLRGSLKQHHKAHKKSLESFVLSEIVSSTKQEAHPRFRGGDAPISPLYPFHHQSLSLEAQILHKQKRKHHFSLNCKQSSTLLLLTNQSLKS